MAWGQGMSKGIMSPPANVRPPYLQNVGIEQRLDAQVPGDLSFVDDTGRPVKLGDYFGRKPLILNLVYYNCPMLCGEALAGLTGSMKLIKFDAGNEFEVITVSFNPQETAQLAAEKKRDYVKRYGRPTAAAGWHFLTGPADSINALTKAVGFQYQYDAAKNQYAHATAIMVLTPPGRISRYFYGSLAGKNRQRRRSSSFVLLSLRSRDWQIWRNRQQHVETGGRADHRVHRRPDPRSLAPGAYCPAQRLGSRQTASGRTKLNANVR